MVIYLFLEWEKLEVALATTENHKVDFLDYPCGAPQEDLYRESARANVAYFEVWEKIRRKPLSVEEIALLDTVVFFDRVRLDVGRDWMRRYGKNWEPRIDLTLIPTPASDGDVYIDNAWNFLSCALNPQRVREVCAAAKKFNIENYKTYFYSLLNRDPVFKYFDSDDPDEDFEHFKLYYASWHAALMDAESQNCGILVFCW